jgi:hypothetical protein
MICLSFSSSSSCIVRSPRLGLYIIECYIPLSLEKVKESRICSRCLVGLQSLLNFSDLSLISPSNHSLQATTLSLATRVAVRDIGPPAPTYARAW